MESVEAKGQKGKDYDLLVEQNRTLVRVEAKSRRAGVILGEKTLRYTLEAARKQLPSSGPAIIFVSIPTEWTMEKDAEDVIGGCISAFFRNSARVNYIVLIWQQWIELKTGKASAFLVRQYEHPAPRTRIELGRIVRPLRRPINLIPEQQDFTPSFW